MLSSLKERILNVSLFNSGEESQLPKRRLNLNAGADILVHFQNYWEELHNINEENAAKAEKLAKDIEKISCCINDNEKNLGHINHILISSNLPSNINKCLENVQHLYNTSETIEKDLIKLEDLIDQAEFEKLKSRHKYHLKQYETRKEESLATFKSDLNTKHLKKIEEYESSKKALLQERQKMFQDAFKTDIEMYKCLGTVPGKVQHKNKNGALLEEVQLDFDQKELDQFFNEEKN